MAGPTIVMQTRLNVKSTHDLSLGNILAAWLGRWSENLNMFSVMNANNNKEKSSRTRKIEYVLANERKKQLGKKQQQQPIMPNQKIESQTNHIKALR